MNFVSSSVGSILARSTWQLPLALGLALICTGCAGVSYRSIDSEAADLSARGLRYYDSSPYILVQTDGKGGLVSEFKYLPDLTKKRQATPYNFLATNTTMLSFTNGIATETTSNADETAVPAAIVSVLKDVGMEAAKAVAFDDPTTSQVKAEMQLPDSAPRVYLFKIVKRDVIDPKSGARTREWGLIGASGGKVKYQKI